jgi:predicted RNA-binding protein with PIN domain
LRIIIDGYNLIRSLPELAVLDRADLTAGREVLLQGLCSYRARKGHALVVVFDGSASAFFPSPPARHGMTVVFSRPPQSADDVLAARCRAGEADLLVTSDSGLAARVGSSVAVVGAGDFWEKVESARMAALKGEDEERDDFSQCPGRTPGRRPDRGPGRRPSKKERKARRLLSRL